MVFFLIQQNIPFWDMKLVRKIGHEVGTYSVAYPGFQRGGCLSSGPIRKVGGGAVHFRSDIRKVGGGGGGRGGNSLQARYEKWCGGGGGGGGGPVRFRSDTFVWHTENTLSLIINGYNFDHGGGGGGGGDSSISRARVNELNCRF